MGYFENHNDYIGEIKKVDLSMLGVFYTTPKDNIKEEYEDEYDSDYDYVSLEYDEIQNVCIDPCNVEYDYTDSSCIGEYFDIMTNHKKYEHFLVVGYGCNWLGSTGYYFTDDYYKCFYRDDVNQYYLGSSNGGKSLMLREYSHDVPTGYRVIIIGLTDKEYQKLNNSMFDDVIAFSNKHLEKIGE